MKAGSRVKTPEIFWVYRQGKAAPGGLQSEDVSVGPSRYQPETPENQGFPLIQGARQGDLRVEINLPSITYTYRWLERQPPTIPCEEPQYLDRVPIRNHLP